MISLSLYLQILVLSNRILDSWYSSVKKLILKNKDGFFILPILSNSPETTVNSLAKMPFVFHNKNQEVFGSNNPILKAEIKYQEIEKGLWMMYSEANYKENVHYKRDVNKSIGSDYYLLFIELNRSKVTSKNALINGMVYTNSSWVLVKPSGNSDHCRFKENQTISLALYFDKKWLENNIVQGDLNSPSLQAFLEGKSEVIILPEDEETAENFRQSIEHVFLKKIEEELSIENEWKLLAFKFIGHFISKLNNQNLSGQLLKIRHIDRHALFKTEKYLLDHLNQKFIGIEALASIAGTSPTKLKSSFKQAYGVSIFQFFRNKQLVSAHDLIKQKKLSVKEVAQMFDYQNTSKFIAAYKQQFGVSPGSEQ